MAVWGVVRTIHSNKFGVDTSSLVFAPISELVFG